MNMNKYIQQKVEEFHKRCKIDNTVQNPDGWNIPYEGILEYKAEEWIANALQDTWNEATKTSNSGRKTYELGRKEMLEEVMECVPTEIKTDNRHYVVECINTGRKSCREELLLNMKKKGLIT